MRLPRVRFTIRRLMLVVATVAVGCAVVARGQLMGSWRSNDPDVELAPELVAEGVYLLRPEMLAGAVLVTGTALAGTLLALRRRSSDSDANSP
jgi:hypothetical protein